MSIDPKAFGLSNSLVGAVNEALKGGQKKLDKNHNGKLDSQDFKMLQKDKKADKIKAYRADRDKHMEEEVEQVDERNTENKAKKNAAVAAVGSKHKDSQYLNRVNPSVADKIRGREVLQGKNRQQHEETDPGFAEAAENPMAKQIAAKKDSMKAQIQQKIAAKQMNTMQAKANKRLSNIHASNDKCTCQEGKKNMSCEVCNSGGKEKVEVNPPMREAVDLPKKVVTKGHEIAKSLIKHHSNVKNPYAVGMATAKKSAGVKEEVEQVDEISRATKDSYMQKAGTQVVRTDLGYGKRHGGLGTKGVSPEDFKRKYQNRKAGLKKANEEFEQVDEVLDSPMKKLAYVMKAKKSIEKSDPKKIKQANDVANRVIGIKRVMNKMNKKD